MTVGDEVSNHKAKQRCLQGTDEEVVTVETASSSVDNGVKADHVSDDDGDNESDDEIEDGELVSSSDSESEPEPEEAVEEKGKTLPRSFRH